ncbi:MAG: thioredoxin family protein [Bacteroidales bacterium]|jgi:thiol-disulfide isomerase/thioredoxin|nr:thioredoxin family protein [Bacteroidales bacterium]
MYRYAIFAALLAILAASGCSAGKKATAVPAAGEAVTAPSAEQKPAATDFSNPETWLLGYFTRSRMSASPHSEWFLKGYDAYSPSAEAMARLNDLAKENLSVKIVLGTWCPDSRREVPHFMRVMDLWNFPPDKIVFIGVDNFKNGPVGEFPSLNIERVPTFIVYENNIEKGRIIENPMTSLEQDMVNILTGMKK